MNRTNTVLGRFIIPCYKINLSFFHGPKVCENDLMFWLIFLHYVLITISIPGSERSLLLAKFKRLSDIATDRDVKYLLFRKCLHALSWIFDGKCMQSFYQNLNTKLLHSAYYYLKDGWIFRNYSENQIYYRYVNTVLRLNFRIEDQTAERQTHFGIWPDNA